MGEHLTVIEFLTLLAAANGDDVIELVGRFQEGILSIGDFNISDIEY